jgi:hypothetical protein
METPMRKVLVATLLVALPALFFVVGVSVTFNVLTRAPRPAGMTQPARHQPRLHD